MLKIKKMFIFMVIITLFTSLLPAGLASAAPTWNLVWSDEFDGTTLNTANWVYDIGTGGSGWGNNELQYYTNRTQNVAVTGGNLEITALKESYGGMGYTSGRIKTLGKQSWTYGKIEARIKLPTGQGIWPAFWMLGSNFPTAGWPACGEMDIMEHVNNEGVAHGTMHWDSNGYQYYGGASPNLDFSQYHVYSIEWDANAIKWFVDGAQYWEGNIANNINGTDEFHKPFFILLNLAVGGNWPGSPDGSTAFPAKMYVDYVRVYQVGGTPTPTPTTTPTVTPAPTSTATPTPTPPPTNSTYPAWDRSKVYIGGDMVSYNGKNYKALWWTQGEEPGVAQVWELATPTTTPTPTTIPVPTPTETPVTPTTGSIYSIAASSIPNPTGNGAVSVKVMNGTNGAYADNQIYWGVIGKNPVTDAWSYLDLSGNLIPISAALNDAPGHLTKNGANYANIYHTVSETSWVNLPQITSGRMFLSVGSPCYIKTYDDGFAGPDINNPTDPNRDIYFDFVEFTVDASGYHGNTTRVDQFGFPVQHRLVNKAGNYDQTVGELESETRAGLFTKYQNEVPAEFKSLGTLQAPYRIVCPISGPFNTGGAYANYFSGYSSISTRDILLGIGGASNPQTCAAINRHIYHDTANWNTVSKYYQAAPANYYAKFWHDHSINGLAYGFCYDDVNGQAAYLEVGDPKGLIIRVGW